MFKRLFKPIDLTEGNVLKVIILFSIPILISSCFQLIYNVTDAAICGQFLTSDEVAGVNSTSSSMFIILQFAGGCTAGFCVVSASLIGKKNIFGTRQSLLVQIILTSIISIILTIVGISLIDVLLNYIGVKEEANKMLYEAATRYMFIIFLGIIFQMFYNLACSFLRSIGDSVTPLIFLIISTFINVGLDLLFIVVFKWGVSGAALATISAQAISVISSMSYIFIKFKEYRFKKGDFSFDFKFVLRHLKLGLPLAFQFSILAFGMMAMQSTIIKFDLMPDGSLANDAQIGYGAACKMNNILYTPISALGTTMVSFVGQNYGKGDIVRTKKGIYTGMKIMFLEYIIFAGTGLLLSINGMYLYIFLSKDKITPEVMKYGNLYVRTVLPFYFMLGTLFVLRNSIQAIEKPAFPFIAGILELFTRSLICLFIPELINGAPITREASDLAYIATSAADVCSWTVANIPMIIGLVIFVFRMKPNNFTIYDNKEVN